MKARPDHNVVSAGHAIQWPLGPDNYMYPHILQWFQQTFPGADHQLDNNAALPATTNLYFSYCLLEHVPLDADIVFVEMGTFTDVRNNCS